MKNGDFKIERGIPVPPQHGRKGYSAILRKMKVGESVVLPTSTQPATNIGYQVFGGSGHITVRKIGPDETRVWRIK